MDSTEELERIRVVPDLVTEMKKIRDSIEKVTDYKINGGDPVISKILTKILRQVTLVPRKKFRSAEFDILLNNKVILTVPFEKVKGLKKCEIV